MVSFAIRVAAVLALASYVQATNLAIVKNHCNAPVYLWSVGSESSEMITVPSHGLPYFEQFQTREDGGWVIKIASDAGDFDNITQFEYTYQPGSAVWYDISNINGYPFVDGGMALTPSVASQASCNTLTCPPGAQPCDDAYNNPDDIDTHACPDGADLTLVLCPKSSASTAKRETAPEASPETSPEAVAEPVPHAQGAKHLHALNDEHVAAHSVAMHEGLLTLPSINELDTRSSPLAGADCILGTGKPLVWILKIGRILDGLSTLANHAFSFFCLLRYECWDRVSILW